MPPITSFVRWTVLSAAMLLPLGAAAPAEAQMRPADFTTNQHVLVGYVANAPNIFLGGGVMFLNPRFVGFFADVRTTRDSPGDRTNFVPGLSPWDASLQFGDFQSDTHDEWFAVNAGLTRVMTPELALYAGAGYSNREAFVEFFDDTGTRGEIGYYWVQDDELSTAAVNVLGGMLFRAGSNLVFQLGGEARPLGGTVGVHYALPLRR
jgi:hypothetical protein